MAYADEIAEEIGCKPNLLKIFFKDPGLALSCLFGPCAPYQYRIMGPEPWKGAKKAIQAIPENIIFPTRTRVVKKDCSESGSKLFILIALLLALLAFLCHFVLRVF